MFYISFASVAALFGSANNWWLRSANTSDGNFRNVNNNGTANNNNANNANGVAFGFCINCETE